MVQHPEVLWAQRSSESEEEKNILYITVNLPDIQESSLEYNLTPTSISFKAKASPQEKEYAFALDFFSEVVPEKSSKKLNSRSFNLVLRKKDKQSEYWPRLTKEKVKNAFLKTDFSKWVDEDEQADAPEDAPEDMDPMGGMGGMPGMGGMGGMPGMGGMGGMPGMGGMDIEKMMAQMGGMGGAGGMPDFGGAGPSGAGDDHDDDDSDDDGPPPLEDAEPAK
ncbi:HSP20-like chaperone [Pholiota conissans]|uniref:HSP20-like chaperone n=1 Tax=Pholiota conissans TaxID=109636 RepID=A0A9P5Z254_9AGAR|nr:HSP20-like chaperone [Pholiota conissans]